MERTSLGHESNSEREKDPESLIGLIINFLSFDESSIKRSLFFLFLLSLSKNTSLNFFFSLPSLNDKGGKKSIKV